MVTLFVDKTKSYLLSKSSGSDKENKKLADRKINTAKTVGISNYQLKDYFTSKRVAGWNFPFSLFPNSTLDSFLTYRCSLFECQKIFVKKESA